MIIQMRRYDFMKWLKPYFKNEALMSNFLLKALLAFVVGQQIYFAQKHAYFHLAVLFMFMIFVDIYDENYRDVDFELKFMSAVFTASAVSVFEKVFNVNLEWLYFAALSIAAVLALMSLRKLVDIIKTPQKRVWIAERNQKVFSKGPTFIIFILSGLQLVLALTIVYVGYTAVTLFI